VRSTHAVVQVTAHAAESIAGLPLLARTVLSLWTAGVTRFTLIKDEQTAADFAPALGEISRVAPDLRLSWITPGAPDPNILPGVRAIVVPTSGVFRPGFFAKLLTAADTENLNVLLPGDEKATVHVFAQEAYQRFAAGADVAAEQFRAEASDYCPARNDEEVDAAERMIFRWCIKETDGVVSRYLNRPVSTWISRRLSHGDIRPMQLTVLTGLLALAMFTTLIGGTPALIAVGCFLYHVTSVIDGLDGEIARAKYMSTPRGAALDTTVDMATNLLFIIGISFGNQQAYGEFYGWVGGYVALVAAVAMMTMAAALHFGPGGGSFDVLQMTIRRRLQNSPPLAKLFVFVNAGFKRDLFALVFAILGITGHATAISWFLVVGFTTWLVAIIVNVPALLSSRPEEVLPPHLLEASSNTTSD
jgi:phosphatidylglycerophosphate synthase